MKTVGRRARDHPVVVNEAILSAQNSIAAAPDGKSRPAVDVEPIHELGGIGADNFDFSQGRCIEDAAGTAHRPALARDRGMQTLAGARKITRALPQAHVLEDSAVRRRPFVSRGEAFGIEEVTAGNSGETAERDGRIGHAKGGQSHLRNRRIESLCHDRERIEIGGFALIGGHSRGRVALDVLDCSETFARGELEVARGDIVLPVDEGLAGARRSCLG